MRWCFVLSLGHHAKDQPVLTPKVKPYICDPSPNHFQGQGLYRLYLVGKGFYYYNLICTKVAHVLLCYFSTTEKNYKLQKRDSKKKK